MVYTLGETLMDILFAGDGTVHATPGGAMLNVSVSLARNGVNVSFLSETGDDKLGDKIIHFLNRNRVHAHHITRYQHTNTSLSVAFLDKQGKPSYSFYKTYPEIRTLNRRIPITRDDYLLFGSIYSLDPAIRPSIKSILKKARKAGALLLYDPNIRNSHHLNRPEIKNALIENIKISKIIKGSDEDFANIFGNGNPDIWQKAIYNLNPGACVIITMGKSGAVAFCGKHVYRTEAMQTKIVSTVGAGDAFSAGMIKAFPEKASLWQAEKTDWHRVLHIAITFAADVCSRKENYVAGMLPL